MKYDLIAEMEDGQTFIVAADGRDLRRWEVEYKQSWIGTQFGLTHLAQLAYLALRRTKQLNGAYPTYELFDAACTNVTGVTDEPASTEDVSVVGLPTQPEATGESSAP